MITQEEIPYTQGEYKAMVKTIDQLRREKRELLDRVCEWLQNNLIKEMSIISSGVLNINISNAIKELRKAMEE